MSRRPTRFHQPNPNNPDQTPPIAARAPEVFKDGSRTIDALLRTFRQSKLSSVYALDIIVSDVEIIEVCDGCIAKINRQVAPSEVAAG